MLLTKLINTEHIGIIGADVGVGVGVGVGVVGIQDPSTQGDP